MEKITMYKKINYYNNGDFFDIATVEKVKYNDLIDAVNVLKNKKINYIENKKGISAIEEYYILYQDDFTNFKKWSKTVDLKTKKEILSGDFESV